MKRSPLAVVMWGVTYLVCLAIIVLLAGATIMSSVIGMETGGYDPTVAARLMGSIGVAYLIAIPLFLIAASIVVAATCRAVLTPTKSGFFFMRLGGAEFRLMGAYLLIALLFIVAIIAFGLVFSLIAGGAFLAAGGLQNAEAAASPMLALLYPAYFGAIILYVWVSVRLSLLGPITVAEGRFALGRAWAATKGRFWVLIDLGAATMVRWFLVYFAAVSLFCLVAVIGAGVISPTASAAAATGDTGQIMAQTLPFIIIFSILMAGFIALQFTILSTPFAVFYRDVVAARPVPEVVEATDV